MDRLKAMRPIERLGWLTCGLMALALVGWAVGSAAVAVPSALGALATGASGAGVDSRAEGDWRWSRPR